VEELASSHVRRCIEAQDGNMSRSSGVEKHIKERNEMLRIMRARPSKLATKPLLTLLTLFKPISQLFQQLGGVQVQHRTRRAEDP